MKQCNVIIAAYKAERWILECIESIEQQRAVTGWEYNVLIGVDSCEATSKLLLDNRYKHYWAEENVGPYVMRNSLMLLQRADAYAIFDADDTMEYTYLQSLLRRLDDGIAGTARYTLDEKGNQRAAPYRSGVCMISSNALQKLGGYLAHRLAADHDLIERARLIGIPITKLATPLYIRRLHSDSLTQQKATDMYSALRRNLVATATQLRVEGKLHVDPVTAGLTIRQPKPFVDSACT